MVPKIGLDDGSILLAPPSLLETVVTGVAPWACRGQFVGKARGIPLDFNKVTLMDQI